MILENLNVKHKTFGDGVVVVAQGNYMTVKFNTCEKKFVYPDAFEKFLTLSDGTVSEEILKDLACVKMEKQVIIDKKNEENHRAMTRGIVIPGKDASALEGEEEEGRNKDNEEII